jgi:hypothetical protein
LFAQDFARLSADHENVAAPIFGQMSEQVFERLPALCLLGAGFFVRHVQHVHPSIYTARQIRRPSDKPRVLHSQIDPYQYLLQPDDALWFDSGRTRVAPEWFGGLKPFNELYDTTRGVSYNLGRRRADAAGR